MGFSYPSGSDAWVTHNNAFQLVDSVSILKGSHTIKVGEIRRTRYNQGGNQKSLGEFDFDGGSTCNPASCTGATGVRLRRCVAGSAIPGVPRSETGQRDDAQHVCRRLHSGRLEGLAQTDAEPGFAVREHPAPWVDKYNAMISPQIWSWGVGFNRADKFGATLAA